MISSVSKSGGFVRNHHKSETNNWLVILNTTFQWLNDVKIYLNRRDSDDFGNIINKLLMQLKIIFTEKRIFTTGKNNLM